jgi:hypothetical protein
MIPMRKGELSDAKLVSPLVLCDRLLTLAQQADHAGYATAARRLLRLAMTVLDEPPMPELGLTPGGLAIPA